MDILEFLMEYGVEILKSIVSIITMFIAWKAGKKTGSAKLMKDIKKLEDLNNKYKEGN